MNDTKTKTCTEEFLGDLYKNVKMGADSIVNILPKVQDGELKQELTAQLNRYEEFAKEIGDMIYEGGEVPKEEGMMAKLSAKVGMAMNTMMDSTSSHIAQMMIEGATMGITENTKLIRQYENRSCSERSLSLAKQTVKFMEDSVERTKKYFRPLPQQFRKKARLDKFYTIRPQYPRQQAVRDRVFLPAFQ